MPYEHIPHAGGTMLDGSFKLSRRSDQPKILVLGTGQSGDSYSMFNVTGMGAAEAEFGADTELMRGAHEAVAQGSDNVAVMRIGGHQGSVVVLEATSLATLTLTPEDRDNEILTRFSLIITEDPTGSNRILVYDVEAEEYVFDTLEEKCVNGDVIRVVDTGIDLYTTGDIEDPVVGSVLLSDLVVGDFTPTGSGTLTSVIVTEGTDGTDMSLPERYAALAQAYHILDFKDADLICPQGVFVNSPNQADGAVPDFGGTEPATPGAADSTNEPTYDLAPGDTLTVNINAAGVDTATWDATQGSRTGAGFAIVDLDTNTLVVKVDGGASQTITFTGADTTLAAVLATINAGLLGASAVNAAGQVKLTSDRYGTGSSIEVVSGSALVELGLTAGSTSGTGDVSDIDAVTFAEVKLVIETDIAPAVTVTQNIDGTLRISSSTLGVASSVVVTGGNARTIFGFDTDTHTGVDAVNADTAVPVVGTDGDALGLVWHYIYQGRLYTYMIEGTAILADTANYTFGNTSVGRAVFTALDAGPAGEAVKIRFVDDVLAGSETASVSGSTVTIHFEDGVSTVAQVKTAYDSTTADTTLATLTVGVAGALTVAEVAVTTPLILAGVLSHLDLTGDAIPAGVVTRWQAAVSSEFRETNFAHQLAVFCNTASRTWKTMLGIVPTLGPEGFDRLSIADWVGVLPTFTTKGLQEVVDTAGDNGSGLLGIKYLAGEAGYRNGAVEEGDGGDGLAYGGFILTAADSLPNGDVFPYGILDTDEAVDSNGKVVDIGRYLVITYDQPKHRNSFNGGSIYRGNLAAALAGKIALTPENREPIGDRGVMQKITEAPRIHVTALDNLSQIRMTGLRQEEGVGFILVDVKTAAHPDSDYTLLSTIRCVNRQLQGIREIGKRYLGKAHSPETIASISSAVEAYLQSERLLGFNQGFRHSITYTRADRILGRLKIKLRMIPPFSIKAVEIEISLAADESEL